MDSKLLAEDIRWRVEKAGRKKEERRIRSRRRDMY